jgi:hypothetical protein
VTEASFGSQLSVLSQVLFDILPLHEAIYDPTKHQWWDKPGLVPTVAAFWKFILTLVLFNLTTASVVLLLSIAFSGTSVASLVGTLLMLFKCVFSKSRGV